MSEQPIHAAAKCGDLAQVRAELQGGANVEANGIVGTTPLVYASWNGHLEVVKYLVNEAGANVEAKSNFGTTPLFLASSKGHLEVVKYLVNEAGANVEAKSNFGWTPLIHASYYGCLEVVKYLVEEAGANVEVKSNDGKTALDVARERNKTTVVQYLEQGPHQRHRGQQQSRLQQQEQYHQEQHAELERLRQELDLEQQRQELEKRRLELERQRQELERQRHQQEEVALICPVFLSHTGADQDAATFAAVLESKLQDKYEIKAFLDSEALKVGDRWREKIEMNAKGCKVFVAILSRRYFRRFWCLYELDLALRHNCRVVPVVYDASLKTPRPTDVAFVRKLQNILLAKGKDLEEDPDLVLNRWLANIKALDGIQAYYNRANHKHWMKQFCNEVAEKVKEALEI